MKQVLGGPMFVAKEDEYGRSIYKKEGLHYNIYGMNTDVAMKMLKEFFPEGKANDLNFVLFSTSGIHGSYCTIEDIEESLIKHRDKKYFYERIIKLPNGCWTWSLKRDEKTGYNKCSIKNKSYSAHRLSAYLAGKCALDGSKKNDHCIDHLCRNRECVNPDHLEVVTGRTNTIRGNGPTAINASKKKCIRGHEFSFENTRFTKKGARICKKCAVMRENNYKNNRLRKFREEQT